MKVVARAIITWLVLSFTTAIMAADNSVRQSLSEVVTIQPGFILKLPQSFPSIDIDNTHLASGNGYNYDPGTGNFTTVANATPFCVYSNVAKTLRAPVYTLAVDGTTAMGSTALKGTSMSNYAVLPYSLTITDAVSNSTTYKITQNNATSFISAFSKFQASRKINCSGNGPNGMGSISLKIARSDWQTASADNYTANITLTASQL